MIFMSPPAVMNPSCKQFVEQIDAEGHFHLLFAHLPGICFFVKASDGRFVLANASFMRRVGIEDERDLIGKTDAEIFPADLAEVFRKGDREVIESGRPMRNEVEMFLNAVGLPEWHITNKLPVRDRAGRVVGVMGTVQRHAGALLAIDQPAIVRAADLIREHCGDGVSVAELARRAGLSPRHFSRRFREVFSVSPQEYLVKTRIQRACQALQDGVPIGEVATACGFYDQSNFGRQFKKHTGITPRQYRLRYLAR